MQAVILAAGEGRRLGPLTEGRPKPMIPVGNRPILESVLDAAIEAGADEIVLVVGHARERIQSHFGDGDRWNVPIHYVTQKHRLGAAHALSLVESHVEGEFLALHGDQLVEAALLERAYETMPTLPFDEVDVLVLDRQGKDISGQGMDTNVIGRRPFAIQEPEPDSPDIKRIYTRGLTETTHGNAMGMGSADFVHADLLAEIEMPTTLINALTASTTRGVRLPPAVETDRAGLIAALSTIGIVDPETVRVVRAPDTMHLQRLYASPALVAEAREREDLRVVEDPSPIEFADGDEEGVRREEQRRHGECEDRDGGRDAPAEPQPPEVAHQAAVYRPGRVVDEHAEDERADERVEDEQQPRAQPCPEEPPADPRAIDLDERHTPTPSGTVKSLCAGE